MEHIEAAVREFFPRSAMEFADGIAVEAPDAIALIRFLKVELLFDMLVDLTAVDYPARDPRFDLIYILYSFPRNQRVRVKTRVGDTADTATGVFPGANWLEREVWDMFGIRFLGHPNLKRILLPEEWTGHPLRKEYAITGQDHDWMEANLGPDRLGSP